MAAKRRKVLLLSLFFLLPNAEGLGSGGVDFELTADFFNKHIWCGRNLDDVSEARLGHCRVCPEGS